MKEHFVSTARILQSTNAEVSVKFTWKFQLLLLLHYLDGITTTKCRCTLQKIRCFRVKQPRDKIYGLFVFPFLEY